MFVEIVKISGEPHASTFEIIVVLLLLLCTGTGSVTVFAYLCKHACCKLLIAVFVLLRPFLVFLIDSSE